MKLLEKPIWNILAIILATIFSYLLTVSNRASIGMAALIMYNLPILLGFMSILVYLLSRLIFKRKNWIITLLAVLFIMAYGIRFYFTDFNV